MKLQFIFLATLIALPLCTEGCQQSSECYHHCGRQTFAVCKDGICVCPHKKREAMTCFANFQCKGIPCKVHQSPYCNTNVDSSLASPGIYAGVCSCM